MLPLKKGSSLLVDASIKAVKTGQTCPDELLKLYYNGVKIFSLENLHAKLFVIGHDLFIGSTNVSGNSSNYLQEAIIKTNDKKAIQDAKAFIEKVRGIELGDDRLKRLQKEYRPPKNSPNFSFKKEKSNSDSATAFWVHKLKRTEWSEEAERVANEGTNELKRFHKSKSRHTVDIIYWYGEFRAKVGDTIVQVTDEVGDAFVSPPGKLIHVKRWSNGKTSAIFYYVEVPKKRRKSLKIIKDKVDDITYKMLNRNGRKSNRVADSIIALWK
jgi:hypothetical protein